jgi:hypothetical protein
VRRHQLAEDSADAAGDGSDGELEDAADRP